MLFLDPDLKQILSLFPPRAVFVVDKADVIRKGFVLLAQMKNKESLEGDIICARNLMAGGGLEVGRLSDREKLVPLKLSRADGERVLRLYFEQIMHSDTLHMDLRSRYFSKLEDGFLLWEPSSLRSRWDASFRAGVLELYEGFYFSQSQTFMAGLDRLGLFGKLHDPASRQKIADVFSEHFGEGRSQPIRFNLDHLRQSFEAIFEVLSHFKVRVDSRFAILGTALCTLYTTLEKIDEALDVRAAYLLARARSAGL